MKVRRKLWTFVEPSFSDLDPIYVIDGKFGSYLWSLPWQKTCCMSQQAKVPMVEFADSEFFQAFYASRGGLPGPSRR